MSRKSHLVLSLVGFLVLFVLHNDFWGDAFRGDAFRGDDSGSSALVLGWMPSELGYRLAWMALAFLYLLHLTRYVWREEQE